MPGVSYLRSDRGADLPGGQQHTKCVTQVGPKVFDGSIKTQLERLRRELKSGAS